MSINREPVTAATSAASPAVGVCEDLIAWYGKYAARARDRYRILEVALLIVGASISVAALAWPQTHQARAVTTRDRPCLGHREPLGRRTCCRRRARGHTRI